MDRIREDLEKTVSELSDTYEEIALIYRITEQFSGAGVEEILKTMISEVAGIIGVKTVAVLFLSKDKDALYTKSHMGAWDSDIAFRADGSPLWAAVKEKRSVAFCDLSGHGDCFNGAVLVCPIIGKQRVIGALVIADRPPSGEFYSNEMKLISAVSSHAALFIENVLLHEEMEEFFIGTIKSFVRAMEATSSWTAGHTERVTEYAVALGRQMALSEEEIERLKICSLLHDIGKIAVPRSILDKNGALSDMEWDAIKRHPNTGAGILEGLKGFGDIVTGIRYHHEWWDGTGGVFGLKGSEIPLMARILAVADTFDAMTSDRPYRAAKPFEETVAEITGFAGRQFDPEVVSAFQRWLLKP